ncbi:MAG: hypothetical protein JXL84_15040 [Deltaproteobacteria bacterium]|nr:hypothetical protein [Deltaproteobacteria bacterium]
MSHEKYKYTGSPLTKVVEECSEVIQIACKIDRFGWFNFHPDDPKETPNIDILMREMDDVIEAFERLEIHMRELKRQHYSANHSLAGNHES